MESIKSKKIILKSGQQRIFEQLKEFIEDQSLNAFILKGYAGTGKTTMMKVFLDELQRLEKRYSLLASTGRAAKIVSNATGVEARTVHGLIYEFKDLNQDMEKLVAERNKAGVDKTGQLLLNFELVTISSINNDPTFYIVDEASMISDVKDKNASQAIFGSGKLLSDLIKHNPRGKFVFVGDECQLPPVMQNFSPALSADYLQNKFGFGVLECSLTEIIRQDSDNDIILSSKHLRNLYYHAPDVKWAKFPMRGYANIRIYPDQASLIHSYVRTIKASGYNESTLICYSNKSCDTITGLIRPMLGIQGKTLQVGDLLLVTQNNYISKLMNGDLVTVTEIGVREKRAGLTFLKVEVQELFTQKCYAQYLLEDVLYANQTNISQFEQKELFVDFFLRMKRAGIVQKSDAFRRNMFSDPYLNALRAVFGVTLTCHKAQGGEWNHVYLDIAKHIPGIEKPYAYQWVYTAMTRARIQLHIVDGWWLV